MGLVTRFAGYILRAYQNFTMEKSMIKKLFSRKGKLRNDQTYFGKADDCDSMAGAASERSTFLDEKQYKIRESISHRHVFRYTFC